MLANCKKVVRYFTIGFSLVLFFGCMKISKKNSEQTTAPPTQTTQPKSNDEIAPPTTTNEIQTTGLVQGQFDFEVNQQTVLFQFPAHWPQEIYVEINDQNQQTTFPLVFARDENKMWIYKWPATDRSIKFIFRSTLDKTTPPLKDLEARPPFSIQTSENIDLYDLIKLNPQFDKIYIEELHLIKGSQIFLRNYSGQVIINKLISESGSIQTFSTNQKAAMDTAGRSGGRVEFKISQGQGFLTLAALGENGGDGSAGSVPSANLKGRKGEDGHPSEFGPESMCVGVDCALFFPTSPCLKSPGDGFPGGQGLKGYRGYPGQVGGNSGYYQVSTSIKELKINVVTRAGMGGQGGVGGAGGEGGAGGDGGDGAMIGYVMSKYKYTKEKATAVAPNFTLGISPSCPTGRKGNDGPRGPDGDLGLNANDGLNERP